MAKLHVHRSAAVHFNIQFTAHAWISIVLVLLLLQLQTPASTPPVTRVITSSTSVSLVCINETVPIWCIDGVRTNNSEDLPFGIVEKFELTADRMANSTLCISGSKISNNTEFQCKIGENIALEVTLVIQGILEAPGNFEVSTISSTAIQLSWEPPFTLNLTDSDPDILEYSTDIVRLNSAGVVHVNTVRTNETMYVFSVVGELPNPCDTFNFSLRAINIEGRGKNVVRFESFPAIPYPVMTTITCRTRPVIEFNIQVNVSCPGRLPDYIHINITAANSSSRLITSFTYNVTNISATGEIVFNRTIGSPCNTSCEAELAAQNEAGVSPSSTVLFECQENSNTTNDGNPTDSETDSTGAIVGSAVALALITLATLLAVMLMYQRRRTGRHTSGRRTASNIYEEKSIDSGSRREIQYADIDVGQALRQQAAAPVIQDLGSEYTHIQLQSQL